ncbi:putative mitochondrial protein [Cucumis melo var. makuwa]|uniref:Mitochondrial protein n=1 Tax=Cucumis melo var. makuwa TaxID=1194695 RepID=A0A5A7UQV6_CUCMM|nr:putative mitochondrial protein [Cucumis melo var. makuwa]
MNQHVIESVNVCIPDSKDLVDKSLSDDEGMVYSEALENSMEKLGLVVSDFDQFPLEVTLEGSPEKSWGTDLQTRSKEYFTSEQIEDSSITDTSVRSFSPSAHVKKNHSVISFIGDISSGIITRKNNRPDYVKMIANVCLTSTSGLTSVTKALKDE